MSLRHTLHFILLFVLYYGCGPVSSAEQQKIYILTSLQVTYSITSALAKETAIRVINIPKAGRPFSSQRNYFQRQKNKLSEIFKTADAVVTIAKLWHADPLYIAVREQNIHTVNIDATAPWSNTLSGISIALEPVTNPPWLKDKNTALAGTRNPSVYFWQSPTNVARSADIIANDLQRLSPADAEQIQSNLNAYKQALLHVKTDYENKFLQIEDFTIFSLAQEFIYLTNDMGIFVDGYFVKQDIQWTKEDLQEFNTYLKANKIKVVIHKWQPIDKIKFAIEDADAKLVVLNTADPGIVKDKQLTVNGYLTILENNLELLYQAFK